VLPLPRGRRLHHGRLKAAAHVGVVFLVLVSVVQPAVVA
jgi:hypothetical protein